MLRTCRRSPLPLVCLDWCLSRLRVGGITPDYGGNYVGVEKGSPSNSVEVAAFTNNGIQTVWVQNLTANPLTKVIFRPRFDDRKSG